MLKSNINPYKYSKTAYWELSKGKIIIDDRYNFLDSEKRIILSKIRYLFNFLPLDMIILIKNYNEIDLIFKDYYPYNLPLSDRMKMLLFVRIHREYSKLKALYPDVIFIQSIDTNL